jgi:hypothetical protein
VLVIVFSHFQLTIYFFIIVCISLKLYFLELHLIHQFFSKDEIISSIESKEEKSTFSILDLTITGESLILCFLSISYSLLPNLIIGKASSVA